MEEIDLKNQIMEKVRVEKLTPADKGCTDDDEGESKIQSLFPHSTWVIYEDESNIYITKVHNIHNYKKHSVFVVDLILDGTQEMKNQIFYSKLYYSNYKPADKLIVAMEMRWIRVMNQKLHCGRAVVQG